MTDRQADLNASLPADAERLSPCENCSAPMRGDQRYCLSCGARRGAPRLDFASLWGGRPAESDARSAAEPHDRAAGDARERSRRSRILSAALACVVLGAGIAAGDLIGPGPASSLASGASSLPVGLLGALAADHRAGSAEKAGASSAPGGAGANPQAREASPEAQATESEGSAGEGTSLAESEAEPAGSESSGSESSSGQSSGEGQEEGGEGGGATPSAGGSGKQGSGGGSEAPVSDSVLARIKYVWLIDLSGSSFARALAKPSADPYLAKQLVPKGTLLADYSLVAASPLANDVALLSGQGSNADTEEDCPSYEPIEPPTVESKGLTEGVGCIYPAAAKTLANQVSEAALAWKAYVQDMAPAAPTTAGGQGEGASSEASSTSTSIAPGTASTTSTTTATTTTAGPSTNAGPTTTAGPSTTSTTSPSTATSTTSTTSVGAPIEASTQTCRHPALDGSEAAPAPTAGADYALARNPFAFFDSLLEGGACAGDDVDLTALKSDLAEPRRTPNLSWIVPSACDDGQETGCGPDGTDGLTAADRFLAKVVPEILASKEYRQRGLLVITFDAGPAERSGAFPADAKVGALLISPFVESGRTDIHAFTTYSLLMSLERLYGVPLLGHANDEGLEELGAGVYSARAKTAGAAAGSRHRATQQSG
jgi:hypothetical protein